MSPNNNSTSYQVMLLNSVSRPRISFVRAACDGSLSARAGRVGMGKELTPCGGSCINILMGFLVLLLAHHPLRHLAVHRWPAPRK